MIARFFRRARWDAERADELEAHLAIETDDNIARGLPPPEARAAARRKLGNVTRIREDIYDMNTLPLLETARLDLRDALRQLRRRPLITALALVLLTIGIGASAAAFSVAYGLLVRPLPYPDADRLMALWTDTQGRLGQLSLSDFRDLRDVVPFESAALLTSGRATLTGGADADRVNIVQADPELLRLLGGRAVLGRLTDDRDEGHNVAVISRRLWQTVFHGDPNVVGRPIGISGSAYTVVGVLAPLPFELPVGAGASGSTFVIKDVDLWSPLNLQPGVMMSRAVTTYEAIVKAKPDDDGSRLQPALDVAAGRLARAYPDTNRDRRFALTPLRDQVVGGRSPAVRMALAGALLILVIACANLASLFLGELPLRRQDFALRAALGATRARLFRQLAIESVLLSLAGAAGGLAVAGGIVAWMKSSADLPRLDAIRFDVPVTAGVVAVAVLAGLAARLLPIMRLRDRRDDLRASVSAYAATAPTLRRGLVVVQLALAVVLSGAAILLAESLRHVLSVDPGFASAHTLSARVSAYAARYPDKAAAARFVDELVHRIAALPGVSAAAAGQSLPLAGTSVGTAVAVEGRVVATADRPTAGWQTVTPGYFHALDIPLVAGRDFSPADLERRTHQTVISQALARRLFGDADPIGQHVSFGADDPVSDWHEVIGVAGDVRHASLTEAAGPRAYDLFGQHWGRTVFLIARGSGAPSALASALRGVVRERDPEAPVFDVRSLDDLVDDAVSPRRLATGFAMGIAAVSMLLAAIGLYGLLASSVASRTRELGIRRALGSSTSGIVALVFGEAAALAVIGIAVGIASALAGARVLQSQLFGVQATDGRVIALVAAALAVIGGVAASVPARRAARVDPAIALRHE